MYANSPVHIAATPEGTVTIAVSKSIRVVLTSEMIDAIVALRKKAKVKKCWIDKPVPPYLWEDVQGVGRQRRAPRTAEAQEPVRDEGQQ